MLIVSKDYSEAYNLAHITNFYIGSDGTTIKASAGTTRGGILGKYNSFEETKTALKIMLCEINKKDKEVIYMPNDNEEELTNRLIALRKQKEELKQVMKEYVEEV